MTEPLDPVKQAAVDYERLTDRLRSGAPFVDLLGASLIEVGPGTSTVELPARPDLLNAGHTLHAGAIFGLSDIAAGTAALGLAARSCRLRDVRLATASVQIDFRRPAMGIVIARAQLVGDADTVLASWAGSGKLRLVIRVEVLATPPGCAIGAEPSAEAVAAAQFQCVIWRVDRRAPP